MIIFPVSVPIPILFSACYGIVDIPKDEWFCQKCIDESEGFKVVSSFTDKLLI